MLSHFLKNKIIAGIAIGGVVTIISGIGIFAGLFENINNHFSDSLYTINEPSKDIIIIAIDDKSTQPSPEGLGRFSQWSRDNFTKLLKVLEKENTKVITFDLIFHTPTEALPREKLLEISEEIQNISTNKEKLVAYEEFVKKYKSSLDNPIDDEFAKELKNFKNIVLAATYNGENLIQPLQKFSANTTLGIVNSFLDETGILRKSTPYFNVGEKTYDDIAIATAKKYLAKDSSLPIENEQMLVNFFGDPFSYEMIPFVDVVNESFDKGYFKDKIVLIGPTSSKEIHDEYYTPRSNKTPMPGIEFRANEIQTILEGKFLTSQSKLSQIVSNILIAMGLTIAFNFIGILLSIILAIFAIGGYILLAHFSYSRGIILNMFYPFVTIVLAYIASWIYKYFIADKKKRELKNAFGHYVSEKLVEQISKNPDMVKLGGEKRVVTVFFSDIKGSTTISEKQDITSWVSQINEYFTVMESVIKKLEGTIDKYEGDAIMGFWNAPVPQESHVMLAYLAALEMEKALKFLHEKWKINGKPLIEFRIGINTGEAIVGNFGSKDRFDYTAMGDTVNTASRLESSANKTYGTSIIVAGFEKYLSAENLKNIILREIDEVLLPGKNEPVKLFELVCLEKEKTDEIEILLKNYAKGLESYRNKNFAEALKYFEGFTKDSPSQIMTDRCKKLQAGEQIKELDEKMVYRIFNK